MYTLHIAGPPVRRQQYTRVPMLDSLGQPVSAFIKAGFTNYRPLNGSEEERRVRATLIATEFGGEVEEHVKSDGYRVFIAHCPF